MVLDKNIFFNEGERIFTASAPGRMDVLGGVADYSGSMLLQMPIAQKTNVSIQLRNDDILKIYSREADIPGSTPNVEIDLSTLGLQNSFLDPENLRKKTTTTKTTDWHLYISGCFFLSINRGLIPLKGANVYVTSDVPIGKGLSSSAAVECATLMAIEMAFSIRLDYMQLPILAQEVENYIVGAPCGLMDQLSVYYGKENHLLPIVCQPALVFQALALPEELHFVGVDSGVKHSVAGNAYDHARTAAHMGYSIIALTEGAAPEHLDHAYNTGDRSALPFRGYLANITINEYESSFKPVLKDTLMGSKFLSNYKYSIDRNTLVKPEVKYNLKACTAHPIFENHRIRKFKELLHKSIDMNIIPRHTLAEMGNCMFQSHLSYTACGLGHAATDTLVNMVKQAGPESGVYGARVTGGGSGGTVCIMAYGERGLETVEKIRSSYQRNL